MHLLSTELCDDLKTANSEKFYHSLLKNLFFILRVDD